MPLPRDCNDSEFALFRDQVMLPALVAFRPDAVVLQCGADAVAEDPQSRMKLSNNAHWDVLRAVMALGLPRLLVTGGGGYNPWSVGRLWTGIWGVLNGHPIPRQLPPQASAVLQALCWPGQSRIKSPPVAWLTTLRDPARPGPVRDSVRRGCAALAARL
jgi:acetoin utilization protein AcuC